MNPNLRHQYEFFLTAARGTECFARDEALAQGAQDAAVVPGGIVARGTLEAAYRLCLWARVVQRVLLPLVRFPVRSAEDLYTSALAVPWEDHFDVHTCFEVECTAARGAAVAHSHFAALRIKDAIADRFRARLGRRPSVRRVGRRLTVAAYLTDTEASLAIDLSGEPLYKRGYRLPGSPSPLKETLGAALLLAADWPPRAARGEALCDPFCGSGTIAIEAALMALGLPPRPQRAEYGFLAWRAHDHDLWQRLLAEAEEQRARRLAEAPSAYIYASDVSASAIARAQAQGERAGVARFVHWTRVDARRCTPPTNVPGIVLTNPPYGVRSQGPDLEQLYAAFGDNLRRRFLGWTAFVFTGNLRAGRTIGLRPDQRQVFWNGAIECRLLRFPISSTPTHGDGPSWRRHARRDRPWQ